MNAPESREAREARQARLEALIDRAVMRRLATDAAYLNAADADEQAEREQTITDEEQDRLDARVCCATCGAAERRHCACSRRP